MEGLSTLFTSVTNIFTNLVVPVGGQVLEFITSNELTMVWAGIAIGGGIIGLIRAIRH